MDSVPTDGPPPLSYASPPPRRRPRWRRWLLVDALILGGAGLVAAVVGSVRYANAEWMEMAVLAGLAVTLGVVLMFLALSLAAVRAFLKPDPADMPKADARTHR